MTFFNGVARRPARPTWSVRTEFVFATVHRGGHSPAATFEWSAVNLERDPVVNGLGGHTNHHSKQVRLEPMSPIQGELLTVQLLLLRRKRRGFHPRG